MVSLVQPDSAEVIYDSGHAWWPFRVGGGVLALIGIGLLGSIALTPMGMRLPHVEIPGGPWIQLLAALIFLFAGMQIVTGRVVIVGRAVSRSMSVKQWAFPFGWHVREYAADDVKAIRLHHVNLGRSSAWDICLLRAGKKGKTRITRVDGEREALDIARRLALALCVPWAEDHV